MNPGQPLGTFAQNMANAEINVIQTEVGLHMKSFLFLASALDQCEEQYPLQGCKQRVFVISLLEEASAMIHLPKELGLQPGNGSGPELLPGPRACPAACGTH